MWIKELLESASWTPSTYETGQHLLISGNDEEMASCLMIRLTSEGGELWLPHCTGGRGKAERSLFRNYRGSHCSRAQEELKRRRSCGVG